MTGHHRRDDDPPEHRWRRIVVLVIGSVVTGAALAVAYGPGYAGYDAAWSLVWGGEIAGGSLPSYDASVAPTPHPLANALAVPLSLLPDGGESALLAVTFLAFGALVMATASLAHALFGMTAAILAAALIATGSVLAREAAFAAVDLPFAALVVGALALEARRPRRGEVTLALLLVAGLLRPEAWLLSVTYLMWLVAGGARGARLLRLAALAVAGPAVWAATDLAVTGNALHSLQGTRDLAAQLERPRGLGTALREFVPSLRELVGDLPTAAAAVAIAVLLASGARRAVPALATAALGVLAFLVIAGAGLPVLLRYLLIPACLMAVFAAGGLVTAARTARSGRAGIAGVIAALAIGVLLFSSIPDTVRSLDDARAFTRLRGNVHRDLRAIAADARFRAAAARCPAIRIPDFRSRPVLLLDVSLAPSRLSVGNLADGERGLVLTYATDTAAFAFNLGAPGEVRRQAAPAGSRPIAANGSWRSFAVC